MVGPSNLGDDSLPEPKPEVAEDSLTLAQVKAFIEMSKMDLNVNLPQVKWMQVLEAARAHLERKKGKTS